jgi:hypothetical protein
MSLQAVKDSFLGALSERLAALNPLRTVVVEGVVRPAVVALENELATSAVNQANAFYLTWTAAPTSKTAIHLAAPMFELGCQISYWTEGSDSLSYQDRGRAMAALDDELLAITLPGNAELKDFTLAPAADLSARVFWSPLVLSELTSDGRKLSRLATLKMFYILEGS